MQASAAPGAPRLLVVTHYYSDHLGGIECVAEKIAAGLSREGLDVAWAASRLSPGDVKLAVEAVPMRAWNGVERRWGIPFPIWSAGSLRRLWQEVGRADVVHLHESLYLGNFLAFLFAKLRGKPVVVTQHVGDIPFRSRALRGLYRLATYLLTRTVLSRAEAAAFVSRTVLEYHRGFVRFPREPVHIPNGVDSDIFHPVAEEIREETRRALGWSADRRYLLFVGRFVEKKGLHLLREAAKEHAECVWVFAGSGPLDPAAWGLPNVICAGRLPAHELRRYYWGADLFILPSVGEGFPLVAQEAMACGTAVCLSEGVAEGLPGAQEHLISIPPTAQGIADAVSRLSRSPEEVRDLGRRAADFAARAWSWDGCVAAYAALIREVLPLPQPDVLQSP